MIHASIEISLTDLQQILHWHEVFKNSNREMYSNSDNVILTKIQALLISKTESEMGHSMKFFPQGDF